MKPDEECPCGGLPNGAAYEDCCRRYVLDGEAPPTCEALMRSRYSAFVVEDADHLWRTWHPTTRPASLGDLSQGTWLGLTIVDVDGGGEEDSLGEVEFIARFRANGSDRANAGVAELHERSRFARRAGRWFYLDGDAIEGP